MEELTYWKSYLDRCSPCHFPALSTAFPSESGSVPVPLSNITPRIQSFCEETEISVSTVVQVAWALVLRAYTGQDSVCFGDVDIESTGVSIVRVDVSDTVTISDVLQTTQAAGVERRAIPRVPFADILRSMGMSDASWFNTAMSPPGTDIPDEYAIVVRCSVEDGPTVIRLDYQTSFLSEKQATGIANTLERAIFGLTGHEGEIGHVSLLSDLDKSQISLWNKGPLSRAHICVDTLIRERCLSQPTAPAICAWDGDFTYGELEDLSSALAKHLVALGVGPEVFVPLCFEKSRWTTVAMLAVIKAGGAFVLLDPSHPVARLRSICESASARVIVVSAQYASLAADVVATVVPVGDETGPRLADSGPLTPSSATPRNALYAVFTSGSTGIPKGVVSEHASFHAAVRPYTQAVGLDPASRVFQFASYAFDVTIFDALMTLIAGGCMCVPSDTDRWSDAARSIQSFRATHAALTPTVARILDPKELPTLRTIVLGGEKLATTDVAKWLDHVRVVHLYGASECTLISIQSTTGHTTTNYAMGSATWIVDPNNHERLLPIGAIGELLVEGPIVGRGYLDNPEKTAATFIRPPDWLCQLRGHDSRRPVYKSGDLAQYTADGSLRFVGRKDAQVKLRGQRIELGEVEHHVRQSFPNASDVVAEVVTTSSRPPMLVAFIRTGNQGEARSSQIVAEPIDEFRAQVPIALSQLQQSLPSYMLPAVFLPLATLPLTSTDKTNRKLLRELAAALSREALEAYQPRTEVQRAPQTPMEKVLQQYFARVLNLPVEQVGADDHFFRRGGDSLAAMKLVAMARKDQYSLTVQNVFDQPQLSALADRMRSDTEHRDEEMPLEPFSLVNKERAVIRAAAQQCHLPVRLIEDVYPCTPLQQGLMSDTMRDSGAFIANLALSLPSEINLERLHAAWTAVAKAHPILRTRMVLSPSHGLLQVVVREDIRWTVSNDPGARHLTVAVGQPLVHLVLCRDQEGKHDGTHLYLLIHHSVYDGWSLPLIFAEVEDAYHGRPLMPQPVSPFVRYLQTIPDGAPYWKSLMQNLQSFVFPALPSKTYQPSPTAVQHAVTLAPGPSARQFTASTYVRLAWAITQAQQQGTSDVFFGTVISGRNARVAGIESMTVPTVATIPCRVTVDGPSPLRRVLQTIQDDSVAGIPFEHMGLPQIRRLGGNAARACSFQTLLVLQPAGTPRSFSWLQQTGSASVIDYLSDATYAINVFCGFDGDEMKTTAIYDLTVVKEDQMQRMLTDFGHVLQALHRSPEGLVRDILSILK
ncbi:hypothetical protein BDV28DRAFT_149612 [Aspergillus coremiiformis]|uniref:Carrier domain-containing protein n=1 Tax=Aspergillus coremiiformis TaxID=138285 RepID=A0A5N6Z704_9EURO|nr:hypothetical protein BDV28DRAFT_149612 [Aspergillus coremiiformis]